PARSARVVTLLRAAATAARAWLLPADSTPRPAGDPCCASCGRAAEAEPSGCSATLTRRAAAYMGARLADEHGRRNAVPGELLVGEADANRRACLIAGGGEVVDFSERRGGIRTPEPRGLTRFRVVPFQPGSRASPGRP